MKLQAGDYIDLRGMSNKEKAIVIEHLSKDNVFWSESRMRSTQNFILFDANDGTLIKVLDLTVNPDLRPNNRTSELLQEMSLSSNKNQASSPKLPEKFKVRNANRPEVREWLAENVTDKIGTRGLKLSGMRSEFLFFNENRENTFTVADEIGTFESIDTPELIFHTGVISYEINDSKKDRLEERKKELERELAELNEELEDC